MTFLTQLKQLLIPSFLFVLIVFSTSCGKSGRSAFAQDAVAQLGASCPENLTVIRVNDGWIWTPCGCTEGDRGWMSAADAISSPIPCTLPARTATRATVLIDFSASSLPHQLMTVDGTHATAPYFPKTERARRLPVTSLEFEAGTFSIRDANWSDSAILTLTVP